MTRTTYDSVVERIAFSRLALDPEIQQRVETDTQTVSEYAEAMGDGTSFSPVIVFREGSKAWLADGFHRVAAAQQLGFRDILAEIFPGGRRAALLFACGANARHGLRRTHADKRRAVATLINDAEWSGWSDGEVARRCGVSQPFVSRLRRSLTQNVLSDEIPAPQAEARQRTYKTRHGTTSTMSTAAIGQRRAESEANPAPHRETPPSSAQNPHTSRPETPRAAVQKAGMVHQMQVLQRLAGAAADVRTAGLSADDLERAAKVARDLVTWIESQAAEGVADA